MAHRQAWAAALKELAEVKEEQPEDESGPGPVCVSSTAHDHEVEATEMDKKTFEVGSFSMEQPSAVEKEDVAPALKKEDMAKSEAPTEDLPSTSGLKDDQLPPSRSRPVDSENPGPPSCGDDKPQAQPKRKRGRRGGRNADWYAAAYALRNVWGRSEGRI